MNMKIKLKTLLASLVIATSFFASVSANAADFQLSFNDSGTTGFTNSFESNVRGQTFQDRWLFTTEGVNDLDSAVISIGTGRNSTLIDLDVTGFGLYDESNTLVVSGTRLSNGRLDEWELSVAGLTSVPYDNYWLQVNGTVVGNGGTYSGVVNMVSAVPEPETYAMMLAGLGLLGAVARRRKAKQA
jgi:hypothetical protein